MKKHISIFIWAVSFFGCAEHKDELRTIDEVYPIIEKIEAVDQSGIRKIRVYVIDSCEYIGHINAFNSDFLTHKGNCKFCTQRNK